MTSECRYVFPVLAKKWFARVAVTQTALTIEAFGFRQGMENGLSLVSRIFEIPKISEIGKVVDKKYKNQRTLPNL